MKKNSCIKQEKKKSKKRVVLRKIKDTYKSMPEEFKSQVNSLIRKTLFDFVQNHKAEVEAEVLTLKFDVVIFIIVLIVSLFLLYCVLEHATTQKKKLYSFEINICSLTFAVAVSIILSYRSGNFDIVKMFSDIIKIIFS